VFENKVLRRIFGPDRDEKLFAKYNYNNHAKEDEVCRACSPNGGKEECV
jgi:hypothetical protein